MKKVIKHWRRRYEYICKKCHKVRFTILWHRKQKAICRACSRNVVPENQQKLFGFPVEIDENMPKNAIKLKQTLVEVENVPVY